MENKRNYEIAIEQIPLLIKYSKGNTSEEEGVKVRKALEKSPRLNNDLHFVIKAHYGIHEEEICPSSLLLSYYYHQSEELTKEVNEAMERHLEGCEECPEVLEEIREFHFSVEEIVDDKLEKFAANKSKSVRNILQELAKRYLGPEFAQELIKKIDKLDMTDEKGVPQLGMGLSGAGSQELTKEEREYLDTVKAVIARREEVNQLLEEGNTDKIRKELLGILEDEKKVDEIMKIYNE